MLDEDDELICGYCYWRICGGAFDECCEKHGKKRVNHSNSACSDFISYEVPSCSSCTYYEDTLLSGKCTLFNKKIKGFVQSPPACGRYIED